MYTQIRHIVLAGRRRGLVARLLTLISLRRQRRALDRLDDTQLRDIGLTRDEAGLEANRPVWDVPPSWRL